MATVRDWLEEQAPLWGRGVNALNFIRTAIGFMADAVNDSLAQSVRSAWLTITSRPFPDEAIEFVGTERGMPRYRADTDETYLDRLRAAWDSWGFAGTPAGIEAQYAAFGLPNVDVVPYNAGHPDQWSWIRVLVYPPHPYELSPRWGSVTWGGFTWGMEPNDVDALVGIVRKWKAGHERVVDIIVLTEGVALWGIETWGAFTWGGTTPPIVLQIG